MDLKLFVLFYDPATHKALDHSLGLEKGQIGVVKAFGDWRDAARNNVVIAHELLHTLGATDKYDPDQRATAIPPTAMPSRIGNPLLPQKLAELMGGVIPLEDGKTAMPGQSGPGSDRPCHRPGDRVVERVLRGRVGQAV